jgi:LDH2 family malate/lactate/ureidoglycolate dehydrogenase
MSDNQAVVPSHHRTTTLQAPDETASPEWAVVAGWSREILVAAGLSPTAASRVVESLVYAERRGAASHGFMRLPIYASRIQAGGINRSPTLRVLNDAPSLLIVDADGAAGADSAIECIDLVVARALDLGSAVVIARNANHFGSAGFYTDMMAGAGLLGIAVCNTDPWMCAPYGGRPVLGTNPIAVSVPLVDGVGPQLDMATSEAAHGKLVGARNRGEPIPTGWAVDVRGTPTNDAESGLEGALLPSGGPKGFGLAFMIDCLLAISGARTSDHAGPLYGDPAEPQRLGHAFIAIAADAVQPAAEYSERVDELTRAVHASGIDGVTAAPLVPGEPGQLKLAQSADWRLDEETLHALDALSRDLNVPVPVRLASRAGDAIPRQKEK